jgi:hypothetical protein
VSFDVGCRVSFRFDFGFVFLILIKFSEDRFVSFPEVSNGGGYAIKAMKVHHERERERERIVLTLSTQLRMHGKPNLKRFIRPFFSTIC